MNKTTCFNRLIIISLMFFLFISFTVSFAHAKLNVVTSTTDLADIVRHIGGDKVTVTSIARGNQDPHHVEPKPSFMLLLKRADLYFVNGMDLEIGWSPPLEQGSRNPRIMRGGAGYVDCSQGIPRIGVPVGGACRSMGDVHPHGNPHYLLDPQNGIIVAGTITDALVRTDPANRDYYNKNRDAFIARVRQAQVRWLQKLQPYRGLKVIAYHDNWAHFARRFGINVVEFIEPKPGISPSPAHVAKVIQTAKAQDVRIIFREPYFSANVPDLVARNTGGKVIVIPHTVDAVPGTGDYFKLFDYITDQLVEAARQTK
jgi:zinc/manganese transport system substrate-binding protein